MKTSKDTGQGAGGEGTVLVVGEVLHDLFPDYRRIGGAPFNFACQLHRLGFPVVFVSALGDDPEGREILDFMSREGMTVEGVHVEKGAKTGRVLVNVDSEGVPTYDILEDVAWDRIRYTDSLAGILRKEIVLVCFGTLAQRSAESRETISRILSETGSEALKVCDLNLRQEYYDQPLIEECLEKSDIVKLNEEELETLRTYFGDRSEGGEFPDRLVADFGLRCLCLTRGSAGSSLHLPERDVIRCAAPEVPGRVQDTVGAGDAYSAMFCAGYLKNLPWERMIDLASWFSSLICGIPGALPNERDFYKACFPLLEGEPNE